MESLAQLEALCERLYTTQDSVERANVESTLKCFSVNTDYISQCQYILDNALTPYALMLASSSLLKQVTEHSLSLQLRLDIWNYVINYLATRGPELQTFVTGSLIQLLCRISKFGWFDDDRFRDVVKEATNFLTQATPDHYSIGLKILNQLVSEINQPNPGLPLTNHRRVACSFRDQSLFQIFQISLTSLLQLEKDGNMQVSNVLRQLARSLALRSHLPGERSCWFHPPFRFSLITTKLQSLLSQKRNLMKVPAMMFLLHPLFSGSWVQDFAAAVRLLVFLCLPVP